MNTLTGKILTLPKMSGSVSTPKSLSGNVGAKTINIGGGTPTPTQEKTVNITKNGTHTVVPDDGFALSKVTTNVRVPIPDGYIVPSGTKAIKENGTHNAREFESVSVNVPIPDGYIIPNGTKTITENGSYDVTEKASVLVDVPERLPILQEKTVMENGEVTPDAGYDGLSKVIVNVESSGGGDLPAGYTRADYIRFTGKQIIDTGIVCTQDTKIKVVFTREKSSQHYLYGVASSDNTASVTAYLGGSWRFGDKSSTKTPATNADMIYSGVVDDSKITITGSVATISGVNEFETIGSLLLGSCRGAAGSIGSAQFEGKIFLFAMWQGDEQVLKLVPVVSTDGVYRFYNEVSGNFFDSITDTPLAGGNF